MKLIAYLSIFTTFLSSASYALAQTYEQVLLCPEDSVQFKALEGNATTWYFKTISDSTYKPFPRNNIFSESGLVYGVTYLDSCNYQISDTSEIVKLMNPESILDGQRIFQFPQNALQRDEPLLIFDTIELTNRLSRFFDVKNEPDSVLLEVLVYGDVVFKQNLLESNTFYVNPEFMFPWLYQGKHPENYMSIAVRERSVFNHCNLEYISDIDTILMSGKNIFFDSPKNADSLPGVTFFVSGLIDDFEPGAATNSYIGVGNFSGTNTKDVSVSISVLYDSLDKLYPGIYNVFEEFVALEDREILLFDSSQIWPDFLPHGLFTLEGEFVDSIKGVETAHELTPTYRNYYMDSLEIRLIPWPGTTKKPGISVKDYLHMPVAHQIINHSSIRRNELLVEGFYKDDKGEIRREYKYVTGFLDAYDTIEFQAGFPLHRVDSVWGMEVRLMYTDDDTILGRLDITSVTDKDPLYMVRGGAIVKFGDKTPIGSYSSITNNPKAQVRSTTVVKGQQPRGGVYDTMLIRHERYIEFNRDIDDEDLTINLVVSNSNGDSKVIKSMNVKLNIEQGAYLLSDTALFPEIVVPFKHLMDSFPDEDTLEMRLRFDFNRSSCIGYMDDYLTSLYGGATKHIANYNGTNLYDTLLCDTCDACFSPVDFIPWTVILNRSKNHLPHLSIIDADFDGIPRKKYTTYKEGDSVIFSLKVSNYGLGTSDSTTLRLNWIDQNAFQAHKAIIPFNSSSRLSTSDFFLYAEDVRIPPIKSRDKYTVEFSRELDDSTHHFIAYFDPDEESDFLVEPLYKYKPINPYSNYKDFGVDYCKPGIDVNINSLSYWIDTTWHNDNQKFHKTLPSKVEFADGEVLKVKLLLGNRGGEPSIGTEIGLKAYANPYSGVTFGYDKFYPTKEIMKFVITDTIYPNYQKTAKNGKVDYKEVIVSIKPSDFIAPGERMQLMFEIDPEEKFECFHGDINRDYYLTQSFRRFRVAQTEIELDPLSVPSTFECGMADNVTASVRNEGTTAVLQTMTLTYEDNQNLTSTKQITSLQKGQIKQVYFPIRFEPDYGTPSVNYSSEVELDLTKTNSKDKYLKTSYEGDIAITYKKGNLTRPDITNFGDTELTWKSVGTGITYYYSIRQGGRVKFQGTTQNTSFSYAKLGYGSYVAEVYATDGKCKLSYTSEVKYVRKRPPPPPTIPPRTTPEIDEEKKDGGSSQSCPVVNIGYTKVGGNYIYKFRNTGSEPVKIKIGIKSEKGMKWFTRLCYPGRKETFVVNPPGTGTNVDLYWDITSCRPTQ